MIEIGSSDLLTPTGIHRLQADEGLSKDQAFDYLASHLAQHPELQTMIRHCHESPQGRKLLAEARRYWDAEGLPVLWDNILELTSA